METTTHKEIKTEERLTCTQRTLRYAERHPDWALTDGSELAAMANLLEFADSIFREAPDCKAARDVWLEKFRKFQRGEG